MIELLRWHDRWGSALKTWEKLIAEGREPPAVYFERPELELHQHLYWDAFGDLTTERQMGFGVGPIPRSKIKPYLVEEWGLSGEYLDHAAAVIRFVDGAYMDMVNAKSRRSSDKEPPVRDVVSAKDTAGVKNLLRRLSKPKSSTRKSKGR